MDEKGVFFCGFVPELRKLYDRIMEEKGRISEDRALGYFYLPLSLHEAKPSHQANQHVQEAVRYMQLNYYRSMTITELAADLGISNRYLYNLLVAEEGISPKQYLSRLRLERTKFR